MIKTIKHKGLKLFYEKGDRSKLPASMIGRIEEILTALHMAKDIEEMNFASYRLHQLSGRRKGEWSITVRANWRIVFRFENENAFNVDFVDYH